MNEKRIKKKCAENYTQKKSKQKNLFPSQVNGIVGIIAQEWRD